MLHKIKSFNDFSIDDNFDNFDDTDTGDIFGESYSFTFIFLQTLFYDISYFFQKG